MKHAYMKKLGLATSVLFSGLLMSSESYGQACSDLFFSEYIEGASGNNKVLEIYNPTNGPIDLSAYSVKLFANGGLTANNTLALTGMLASHDVVVISHYQANAAILALTDIPTSSAAGGNPTNFNGNDAVAIVKTVSGVDTFIDIIGNIGCNPGTDWNNGGTKSTVNRGLRRKATVTSGIAVDPADTPCDFPTLDSEWDDFVDTDYSSLGSHTATGCGSAPTNPIIAFTSGAATVNENAGAVTVTVQLANPSATAATSVDVALGTGTATDVTDFTFTGGGTLTWAAGDNSPKTVTINVVDDNVIESNETVVLSLSNATSGAVLGAATHTLTITDNDAPVAGIPTYTVAQITTNNTTTGLPDSMNVQVKVVGILYGINQRTAGGLQLTLIDPTGGVGLFKTNNTNLPTTLPMEGDSIRAIGTVGHFNGLTQITLDSVKVLGTRALRQPMVVNGPLTEAHESEFIRLANPVTLVDATQWTNAGTGFTVQVTDGTNTYDMRIVAASDVFGSPAPTTPFMLTGIGGQFDNADPRDSGYQIMPRRLTDISRLSGLANDLANTIVIYPNPASTVLNLNLNALNGKKASVSLVNSLGQEVAKVPANATEVNVAGLPAGIYMLRITAGNTSAAKRFVKIN